MYTEPMALTGYINICIICKDLFLIGSLICIYSLGNQSTDLYCPPVIMVALEQSVLGLCLEQSVLGLCLEQLIRQSKSNAAIVTPRAHPTMTSQEPRPLIGQPCRHASLHLYYHPGANSPGSSSKMEVRKVHSLTLLIHDYQKKIKKNLSPLIRSPSLPADNKERGANPDGCLHSNPLCSSDTPCDRKQSENNLCLAAF